MSMKKKARIRWAVALAGAAVLTISIGLATALASPSSGTITPVIIGVGMPKGMRSSPRPGTNTSSPIHVRPDSSTGWHSHPGKTLVIVQSGTVHRLPRQLPPDTYGPGSSFVECPRACTSVATRPIATCQLGVVFFDVPIGGSPRIDQPQPEGCDVT